VLRSLLLRFCMSHALNHELEKVVPLDIMLPDLNSLHFFLSGYVKTVIYLTEPCSN